MPFDYRSAFGVDLEDFVSESPLRTPAHDPAEVALDFDAYVPDQSPEAVIRLTHHDPDAPGGRVEFFAYSQEELFIDSSAQYTAPWEDLLEAKNLRLAQGAAGLNLASELLGGWGMKNFAKVLSQEHKSLNNAKLSTHQWISSERPQFPVSLTFLALDEKSTPEKDAVGIMSRVYPRKGADSTGDTLTVTAPGGYQSGGRLSTQEDEEGTITDASFEDRRPVGTWTLEHGTWLRVPGLVLVNANLQMSPIRTTYNQPLFVKVEAQFETHRIVTEEEYRSYFLYVD